MTESEREEKQKSINITQTHARRNNLFILGQGKMVLSRIESPDSERRAAKKITGHFQLRKCVSMLHGPAAAWVLEEDSIIY
jgi:hypothetical protein